MSLNPRNCIVRKCYFHLLVLGCINAVFYYLFVHWAWRNAASVPKLIMMKIRFGIPTRQTMRVKVVLFDELMLHIP
jgi:hypothetical protein